MLKLYQNDSQRFINNLYYFDIDSIRILTLFQHLVFDVNYIGISD